jgi:LmbE family N-acetylglucosaminyl deacetylase
MMGCALAVLVTACVHGPAGRTIPSTSTLRVPARARVLVFAPHPDDETLAVGGLIHRLTRKASRSASSSSPTATATRTR